MKRLGLILAILLLIVSPSSAIIFFDVDGDMIRLGGGGGGGGFGIAQSSTAIGSGSAAPSLTGVAAGALLVVTVANENDATTNTPTSSPTLTWTKRAGINASGDDGANGIYTATFTAGGSITVTYTHAGRSSAALYEISSPNATQTFTAAQAAAGQTAPSVAITTTVANSILIAVSSDYAATSGSATYRTPPTHTEKLDDFQSGAYHAWHYYIADAGATGAKTIGMTAPTGQAAGTAVLEIIP